MKLTKILAALLVLALALSACSAAAVEEPETGMGLAVPWEGSAGASGFTDIPAGAYYETAANWCREQGILTGDTFAPDAAMTRATVADALYRAEGSPAVTAAAFPDVPAGSQYADASSWASANGVMGGCADGRFGAADPVTRQQMAAVLWRYAGSPSAAAGEDFADESAIASHARTAVDWARANGVINGKEGNRFDPAGTLTRAQTAAILYRYLNQAGQESAPPETGDAPAVYMTTDISSEGLMKIYESLGHPAQGEKVAVKLSMGEPGGHNFLQPSLIEALVKKVDGTIVDSNTAYGGRRASTAGQMLQHSGGHSSTSWGGGIQDQFLEAMAEAAKSVDDYMGENILYISVMNKLSVDCDCDSNPAEPDMHDIGILASLDPVALDQACVDLVYTAEDGASLIQRIESRNGIHTLEHAEKIGLGSREYRLVSID